MYITFSSNVYLTHHLFRCQEVLLDIMELGKNIARNAALRENIFMMAVCVDLRIPLFLVGKPGSSKSLAKSIVSTSMQGQASSNELLKTFKQVSLLTYVGHITVYAVAGTYYLDGLAMSNLLDIVWQVFN